MEYVGGLNCIDGILQSLCRTEFEKWYVVNDGFRTLE